MKTGNPQGKGLTPVLDDWRDSQAGEVGAKSAADLLSDYFVALLVLSAEFPFRPVPGVDYYLYLKERHWMLSLIAPDEWGQRAPGPCLGRCILRKDMTWRLHPRAEAATSRALTDALAAFHEGFLGLLKRHDTLDDSLPYYVRSLPYYRRLLAAGLASSLDRSLALGKLSGRSSRQWLSSATDIMLLPETAAGTTKR